MSEEETFSTGDLTTGVPEVDDTVMVYNAVLSTPNLDTGIPVVDRTVIIGDHYFLLNNVVSGIPVLGEPYYDPALARVVNIGNQRIGSRTEIANSNSVRFDSNNKVKIG